MAGPEPYPQEKWTVEQEQAFAEGRASAKGSSGSASRSGGTKTGSGKKRYVRTAEGARRYKVPIGAEIGTARKGSAGAAAAQKDTESRTRYEDLVGQDPDAQSKAMAGLNDDQLKRLSAVAYSFPSSNPDVVRLRVGVAAELRKRGLNVNDFGGLGGGSARAAGPSKSVATPNHKTTSGIQAAMTRMYGNKAPARASARKNLSVPQLRQALGVFGKVAPDKRKVVASFLVDQAIELGVPHMLGQSVVAASGQADRVIELAGRWKHGYIPLDAVALESKMKGRTGGKQWWSRGSGGGTEGRLHSAVGVPKGGNSKAVKGRKGTVPSGSKAAGAYQFKKRDQVAEHNKVAGSQAARDKRTAFLQQQAQKGTPAQKQGLGYTHHKADGTSEFVKTGGAKRKPGVSGKPSNLRKSIEAGKQARASRDRTSVVKSGSTAKTTRGATMNRTQMLDEMAALSGKKNMTEADKERVRVLRGMINDANRKIDARKSARGPEHVSVSSYGKIPQPGPSSAKTDLTGQTDTELNMKKSFLDRTSQRMDLRPEDKSELTAINKELARRKAGTAASGTGGRTTGETAFEKAAKARVAAEPFPAAASYLDKNGVDKTREKLTALKTKRSNLKAMGRKTASVDLEIKGLENVLARNSGKA